MNLDTSLHEPIEAARAAFLRGIEHRGRVLAEAQCGDRARAGAVLAECKIGFHQLAEDIDPADWTLAFWQSLLAHPALRVALAPDPRNPFSQLAAGQRAALLLRLVAGLEQDEAAQVLEVAPETYRHALARALEVLRAKGIDESVLHFVRDSLQRDATPLHAVPASADPPPPPPPRWSRVARRSRPLLAAVAGVLAIALLASFFWLPPFLRPGATVKGFQALREHAPAATLSPIEALVGSSDFDLLADPQGERIARDLDVYAWYAAASDHPGAASTAGAALPETTQPETAAPDADAEDAADAASAKDDATLPIVAGHPVPAASKRAASGGSDAH